MKTRNYCLMIGDWMVETYNWYSQRRFSFVASRRDKKGFYFEMYFEMKGKTIEYELFWNNNLLCYSKTKSTTAVFFVIASLFCEPD